MAKLMTKDVGVFYGNGDVLILNENNVVQIDSCNFSAERLDLSSHVEFQLRSQEMMVSFQGALKSAKKIKLLRKLIRVLEDGSTQKIGKPSRAV